MTQKREAVAAIQRDLAAGFAETMSATEGLILDYGSESISQLDDFTSRELSDENAPLGEALDVWKRAMGAYVGEVLVRTLGGSWTWDEQGGRAAVELPGGEVAHPDGWANNRLVAGHSLQIMYKIAGGLARGEIDPNDPKWPTQPN